MFRNRPIEVGTEEITKEQYNLRAVNDKTKDELKAVLNKKEFLISFDIEDQRRLSYLVNKAENRIIIDWYFSNGYLSKLEAENIVKLLELEVGKDSSFEDLLGKVKHRLESLNYE